MDKHAVLIRKIEKKDLQSVIEVHCSAFNSFFLTELGNDFLKLYYGSLLKIPDGYLFGYFIKNELLGFCAATTQSAGFNVRLIKSRFIHFFCISLKLLFTNPKALLRLCKNFTKKSTAINDDGKYAELLSIAVNTNKQGLGIGKLLLQALENDMQQRGCKKISLTTDFYDNENAIQFYKKFGYEIMYEFTAHPDRKMYRLIKDLQK